MEQKIIILSLFALFLIAAIVPRIIQKRKKIETIGCIGINKKVFIFGKICLFASFLLILVQLFFVNISVFEQKPLYFWICAAMFCMGDLLFILAIIKLGTFSLRVGLSQEKTSLRETGIYRFSRNPMLLGLYMMALGSAVYVQNPINWVLIMAALAVHHKIILAEEIFLKDRFKDQWINYKNSVRRYF